MIIKFKVGEYYEICDKYEELFSKDEGGFMTIDDEMFDSTCRRFVIPELHISFRPADYGERVTARQLEDGEFNSVSGFLFYPENEKNPYKFDTFTGCGLSFALTEFFPSRVKPEVISNLDVWFDMDELLNEDCFEEARAEFRKARRAEGAEKRKKKLEAQKAARLAREKLDALNPFGLCWLENHLDSTILCARCKSKKQLNWILKNKCFYFLRGYYLISNISDKQIDDASLKFLILYFNGPKSKKSYYVFRLLDENKKYIDSIKLKDLGYLVPMKHYGYNVVGVKLDRELQFCGPGVARRLMGLYGELASRSGAWDEFTPVVVSARELV